MNEIINGKKYDFIKAEIDEVEYLLDKISKDCKKKFSIH